MKDTPIHGMLGDGHGVQLVLRLLFTFAPPYRGLLFVKLDGLLASLSKTTGPPVLNKHVNSHQAPVGQA